MASKLRGAAPSTWPPGGAGRRASTEVEKTESQQTENSHQCTCAELAQPWWDEEDRARPSHQHTQLPPAQGLGPAKLHAAQ